MALMAEKIVTYTYYIDDIIKEWEKPWRRVKEGI
jgi:hypothetical protein